MAPPTLCTETNDTCAIGWTCLAGICRRNDGSCDPSMDYDDSALWVQDLPHVGIAQFAVPDCWLWAFKNQPMQGDSCLDDQALQENHGVVCQEKKCYQKCFIDSPSHLHNDCAQAPACGYEYYVPPVMPCLLNSDKGCIKKADGTPICKCG